MIINKETFSKKNLIMVSIITILCLIPFINKAFHIDDTLFIWSAKQIQANPIDFYGFTANWYGVEQPMFLINQNPPLVSYFIAVITWFFGFSEAVLHISFIIPAVSLVIGICLLARFFCNLPCIASLVAILTPVFLVSSTNIMSDTLMLTFYVWAVLLWLYGIEKDKYLYLLCGALLIAASALTKYFGMSLIPLLFVYSLTKKRKLGIWILFLIIPIFILIGYQLITFLLYDNFLISNAAKYAINLGGTNKLILLIRKTFTGLSFVGGCLIGIIFFTPMMWSRKTLFWAMSLLSLFIIILIRIEAVRNFLVPGVRSLSDGFILQYALFIFTGIQIILLAVTDLWKNKTPESLLLFLWIFGSFFFANYLNWVITARVILPITPVAGILVMRRLNEKSDFNGRSKVLISILPLILAAIIALSVTWADTSLANNSRSSASAFHEELNKYPHTIWFQGHWGFQYYMEKTGAKALDYNKSLIKAGDLIIIPLNNSNIKRLDDKNPFHFVGKLKFMPLSWIGTMSAKNSAGFYCSALGFYLPFSIGNIEPEEYQIFLVGNFTDSGEAVKYFVKHLKSDSNILLRNNTLRY